MTAQELFNWARKYAERHEDAGRGTQYPTMREATKRFHCTLDDIEDIIDDDIEPEDSYLGLGVAWRVGNGVMNIEHRGDYVIEAY